MKAGRIVSQKMSPSKEIRRLSPAQAALRHVGFLSMPSSHHTICSNLTQPRGCSMLSARLPKGRISLDEDSIRRLALHAGDLLGQGYN